MNKNTGRDTFVRSMPGNGFRPQASRTYQTLAGEILFAQPEPLYKQTVVTVEMARGGKITSVAYPGAFFDPKSGNLHGTYEGPIPGQMVMVGFENGNFSAPYVVNRYPYQGKGNTLTEPGYYTPLTKALFDATDVITGHFSGSYLAFYTGILSGELPGSVKINAMTDFNVVAKSKILLDALVSAEVKSAIVKLTASNTVTIAGNTKVEVNTATAVITASTQIELNGNGNWAIKYTEMKSAFDTMKTDLNNLVTVFNAHTHLYSPGPSAAAPSAAPASPGTPSAADMSGAKNAKVLM